jgi:hypothetical protein
MFTGRRRNAVLLLGAGLVLTIGTAFVLSEEGGAPGEPTVYAVEGKVLVDGAPAENLNVGFHPLDSGKNKFCPVGRTDSHGIFDLTSRRTGDGAPAGEYRVTLVWPDGSVDDCECIDPTLHDRLKGSYAKPVSSKFQVTVGPIRNTFWFSALRPR